MINKLVLFLAALLLLASSPLPAAAPANGQALEHLSLQLKYFHQFQFAGYYAEEGLDRMAETYAGLNLAPVISDEQLAGFIHTAAPTLHLSIAEHDWLARHPTIRVGIDHNFPPYEWIDQDGNYVGMVAEHLRLIEKKLGVQFEIIPNKSWYEILDMAKRGELDMIAAITETPERRQYLSFGPPYVSTPAIVIGDDRLGYIGSLDLLAGQSGYQNQLQFAAGKAHPELLSILQKALNSIPADRRESLINRWMGLQVDPGIDSKALIGYAGTALLLLLFFSYWVFRLRKEIKARRRSEADLALLYRNMSLGLALHEAIRDKNGRIIDSRILMVNPAFETIIGIKATQCVGKRANRLELPHLGECIQHFANIETQHKPAHFEIHYPDRQRWLAIDAYQAGHNRFVVLLQDISQRKLDELALKASEERLRVSQHYGGVGTWEFDLVNNRHIWSEIVSNGLGFPKTENPKWAHFLASICKEDRPIVIDALRKHLRHGAKFDVEYRINVTGKKCWMRSVGQVERNENGKPLRMLGIVQDISERKRAEEKLKLSARVFSDAHEGIMITDAEARILDVNAAFTELTGFGHAEVIGKKPSLLKSDRQAPEFYSAMWTALNEEGHWQGEIWNRHKNNEVYAQLLTISALRDESGATINYIGLFSDITERKQQQELLEHMAHFDPLTGLPNRTLFSDRFNQAIAHTKRSGGLLAICYLDLDGFKPVNDTFGHAVGDELLIEVAKRIKSNLRECDTVCRLGGDEFALLLLDLQSRQQCEDTLDRIHSALAEPFTLNVHPVWISASCGVTLYPLDDVAPYTLLRHADQAMYQAKRVGRNCYRIYLDLLAQGVVPHETEQLAETE
ncbi:MAG: diguanylate cyclase [Methylomonas sp.]|nr:diguanylate cyclase [Methylomonas sp.]